MNNKIKDRYRNTLVFFDSKRGGHVDDKGNSYVCEETLTINEVVDVPTPVFKNFPKMLVAGEDLVFTLEVDDSKITKGPITYDARLYKNEYAVGTATSSEGTVTVTVPWSAFEEYYETEPGTGKTLYVRAHGRGYNAKDIEEDFVIGGEQDAEETGEIKQGPFRLNTRNRTLEKNGERVRLTQIEYSIIKYFMDNPGKALSREDILNEVWGRDFFGELKIVDVNIRRLRIKIEDDPTMPAYITTVWGYGYKWGF